MADDLMDRAALLVAEGKFGEALPLLRKLVAEKPKGWKPRTVRRGRISQAFWDQPEFLSFVAYHTAQGKKEDVSWARPSYSRAHYYLAFIASEEGRYDEALEEAEAALKLEPDHPKSLCEKALALSKLGRHEEALELFTKAVGVRPWSPKDIVARAMRGAGVALIDLGRLDDAERALKDSLELEPDSPVARHELAYISQLRKGIAHKPGDGPLYNESRQAWYLREPDYTESIISEMAKKHEASKAATQPAGGPGPAAAGHHPRIPGQQPAVSPGPEAGNPEQETEAPKPKTGTPAPPAVAGPAAKPRAPFIKNRIICAAISFVIPGLGIALCNPARTREAMMFFVAAVAAVALLIGFSYGSFSLLEMTKNTLCLPAILLAFVGALVPFLILLIPPLSAIYTYIRSK